jgi:serine/threonine-protein kinase PpkA
MATVYLAVQNSVDREVALKIMAPQLSLDPSFGERFLREARIAAKLQHRHVVSIFDVGVYESTHYAAMEYMSGGTIMPRDDQALDAKAALRCIREIAAALDYAHAKGFIHRDVKPDNILLRDDGSSVLSDFGIARAADSSTVMTKTGAIVGTPHYMSPEQLRGQKIDGRADLYSLGVVFYQLLTASVPYQASDSLAIGIMHMTAPIPQLPHPYQPLQGLLSKLLAKDPRDRLQTGMEVVRAVESLEDAISKGRLPALATNTRVFRAPEEMRIESEMSTTKLTPDPDRRHEPSFGKMEDISRDAWRAPMRTNAPRAKIETTRRWPILLLSFLLAAGAGAWFYQEPLQSWLTATTTEVGTPASKISATPVVPSNVAKDGAEPMEHSSVNKQGSPEAQTAVDPVEGEVQALLAQATSAKSMGRLFEKSGSAAIYYRQVLKLQPKNQEALLGLAQCVDALQIAIADNLNTGDTAAAATLLDEYRSVDPSEPRVAQLQQKIEKQREQKVAAVEVAEITLAKAQAALQNGQLISCACNPAIASRRRVCEK